MKTVRDMVSLLSYGTPFVLIGARTGKKLANSTINKRETIEKKWFDKTVAENPIYCSFYTYKNFVDDVDMVKPIINIWVSGE